MAIKETTGLETHPSGTTGLNGIINGNWERLDDIFTHRKSEVLASSVLNFAIDSAQQKTLETSTAETFTTSGKIKGSRITLVIKNTSGSSQNMNFPASFVWVGHAKPAALAAGKTALVELECIGTTDADVIARWNGEA